MDLKNFKLLKEDGESYTVAHPKGKSFQVSKSGLSEKAHVAIQKLKGNPQNFDDGGAVQSVQPDPTQDPTANLPVTQPNQTVAPEVNQPVTSEQIPSSATPGVASEEAYAEEKAANNALATAVGGQGTSEADSIDNFQTQLDALPSQQDIINKHQSADEQFAKAYSDNKIDRNRIYKDGGALASTGNKVLAGIGIILGGIGAGLNHTTNSALQMMNDAIDRDIDAQKNDQSRTMNLWKMNREALGNDLAANITTKNQLMMSAKMDLQKAASQYKGPIAQANAQQANAIIDKELGINRFKLSLLGGPTQETQDPATKVGLLQRFGMATPEQAKQSLEEIKNRQNIANNGDKILAAFDQAAEEQRTFGGGNPITDVKNLIPGINSQGVGTLHQLMLPNFKTIDGTVRQAAMDESFHNLTPQAFDSNKKIAEKREGLVNWINSEKAAPVSKSIGLDLDKYHNSNWQAKVQPVERIGKDGKVVLFDPQTKKPLRYK